jgi:hypothetical protein
MPVLRIAANISVSEEKEAICMDQMMRGEGGKREQNGGEEIESWTRRFTCIGQSTLKVKDFLAVGNPNQGLCLYVHVQYIAFQICIYKQINISPYFRYLFVFQHYTCPQHHQGNQYQPSLQPKALPAQSPRHMTRIAKILFLHHPITLFFLSDSTLLGLAYGTGAHSVNRMSFWIVGFAREYRMFKRGSILFIST